MQINQVEKGMEDKLNNKNELDGNHIKELNAKQTGLYKNNYFAYVLKYMDL